MKPLFRRLRLFASSLSHMGILLLLGFGAVLLSSGNSLLHQIKNRETHQVNGSEINLINRDALPIYIEAHNIIVKKGSPSVFEYEFIEEDFIDYLASFFLGKDTSNFLKHVAYPAYTHSDSIFRETDQGIAATFIIVDASEAKKKIRPPEFQYSVKYDSTIQGKLDIFPESSTLDCLRVMGVDIATNPLVVYKNQEPLSLYDIYFLLSVISVCLSLLGYIYWVSFTRLVRFIFKRKYTSV